MSKYINWGNPLIPKDYYICNGQNPNYIVIVILLVTCQKFFIFLNISYIILFVTEFIFDFNWFNSEQTKSLFVIFSSKYIVSRGRKVS